MILKKQGSFTCGNKFFHLPHYVFALHATIKEQVKNFEKMVLLYSNP